jgi:hypothetical protein
MFIIFSYYYKYNFVHPVVPMANFGTLKANEGCCGRRDPLGSLQNPITGIKVGGILVDVTYQNDTLWKPDRYYSRT